MSSAPRIFLNVPFDKKDDVKALRARWDPVEKKWYSYADNGCLMSLKPYFVQSTEEVTKILAKMKRDNDRQPKPLPKPKKKALVTARPVAKSDPSQLTLIPFTKPLPVFKCPAPPPPPRKPSQLKQTRIASFNSFKP
jgi:hypothetical protein